MKAIVCLMLVAAACAYPPALGRGRPMLTYDNSLENGVMQRSMEWVYPIARGGGAQTKSSFPQRVEDLQRILDSGYMDRSDEMMLRTVMNNPERFGNREYVVDASGEVYFLPVGGAGAARDTGSAGAAVGAGSAGGFAGEGTFGATQPGTGALPVKK
ncbi:hypothetical protein SK128_009988 [Halocaridina rubra]|uniref:Uncharacterized protein n=1 Tax=Halocaridina rubra TaxID=373956 RepID=A0AAN8X790_HALRR